MSRGPETLTKMDNSIDVSREEKEAAKAFWPGDHPSLPLSPITPLFRSIYFSLERLSRPQVKEEKLVWRSPGLRLGLPLSLVPLAIFDGINNPSLCRAFEYLRTSVAQLSSAEVISST